MVAVVQGRPCGSVVAAGGAFLEPQRRVEPAGPVEVTHVGGCDQASHGRDGHGQAVVDASSMPSPPALPRLLSTASPNVRGSTGYGREYQELIHHDWGGGDLRDFEAGAQYLRRLTRRP